MLRLDRIGSAGNVSQTGRIQETKSPTEYAGLKKFSSAYSLIVISFQRQI